MALTLFAAVLAVASVSDAAFLRMGAMPAAPKIDNVIERAEECASSIQYGLVSHGNGLMSKRYSVAHVGYTDKGFYFATRTSVPAPPQQLTDEDRVSIELLPPGRSSSLVFSKKVSAGRVLDGIKEYGVLCAEVEMFIPFSDLGVEGLKNGEKWGLQMRADFSSERETATWHWNKSRPGELGTLVVDRDAPIVSLAQFGMLEHWRQTANYKIAFRVANATKRDVRMSSASTLYRGIGFSKLDSEPEKNLARETKAVNDLNGLAVAPGQQKTVYHTEWSIWPGTVACLDLDIRAEGRTVYRRKFSWDISRGNDWKPDNVPVLDFKFFPSYGNRIVMSHRSGGRKDLVRGKITIRGKKAGKIYWEKELATPAAASRGRNDLTLPDLPNDDYEIVFECEDKSGGRYVHTRTFQVASFPWQGNAIGKDRVIIPPFCPIKVENDGKISFLQTGYRCRGVLWDGIRGKDENILAAPATLKLNGAEFAVTGTRIVEASPDRVVREVTAECGGVKLVATQDYDYDGFCWVTLSFSAPQPVKVESLRLEVPIKDKIVRFVDHLKRGDARSGPAPDISVPQGTGVVWDSHTVGPSGMSKWTRDHFPAKIHPYLYLGGTFKGLAWLIDSVRDLSVSFDRSPQRLVRDGDVLTYEFDIVSVPTVWKGDKRVEMGFQPTPVKPRDPAHGKFAENLYNYDCPSNAVSYMCFSETVMTPMISDHSNVYPNDDRSLISYIRAQKRPDKPAYSKAIADYVERNRAWLESSHVTTPEAYADFVGLGYRYMWGGLRVRYFDPMIVTCFWPEWEMYKGEWYPEEWTRENYYNEYMCNLCPSRIDKLMSECEVALRNGADGLYYDCFYAFSSACFPQGDAYLRDDGTIQWSLSTIRYWREIMKRSAILCYKMGKTYNGRPVVELHDTEGANVMIESWCMTGLSNERSGDGGVWPIRFPESFTLVTIVGANTGKGDHFIVRTTAGDTARKNRELISLVAYMCAYGVFALEDQGVIGGNERFFKAWNIPFDFGWGNPEVEQFHYWNEEKTMPVSHTGKNVRLTVGKKKGAALLMFGNLGEADEEIAFDVSGLGFGPSVRFVDAETREPLREPRIRVPGYEYRMIEVVASQGDAISCAAGTEQCVVLKPGGVEVVLPAKPLPVERFAAQELTNFLSRVLGTPVPVVAGSGMEDNLDNRDNSDNGVKTVRDGKVVPSCQSCRIVLGRAAGFDVSALERDAFRIKAESLPDGRAVIRIAGRDDKRQHPLHSPRFDISLERATSFGVYAFLEDYAGVRFYFPGELGTVVPKRDKIVVPDVDRVVVPDFSVREWYSGKRAYWFGKTGNDDEGERMKRLDWLRLRMGTKKLPLCHGTHLFKYVERFGKTHPEYFSLKTNGSRTTENEAGVHSGHLCWTSPVVEELYQDVKAALTGKKPSDRGIPLKKWGNNVDLENRIVDIMPQDGQPDCACENCQKAYRAGESPVWLATKAIAERLTAEGVEGTVTQMCYGRVRKVPEYDLPPNILVQVAVRGQWSTGRPDLIAGERKQIVDWMNKLGHKVWLWTYPGKHPSVGPDFDGIPQLSMHAWGRYFKNFADFITGCFSESETDRFSFNYLNYYVYSRVCWDVKTDIDAVLDEHYRLMFGAAAADMKELYTILETKWTTRLSGESKDTPIGPVAVVPSWTTIFSEIYPPDEVSRLDGIVTAALSKVAPGSLEARRIRLIADEFVGGIKAAAKAYADRVAAVEGFKTRAGSEIPLRVFMRRGKMPDIDRPLEARVTTRMDDKAIYATFVCEEPNMDKVAAKTRPRDDNEIWADNSIEWYFCPTGDRTDYCQIGVNSEGAVFDIRTRKLGAHGGGIDKTWGEGVSATVEKGADSWTCRITVPFAAIGGRPVKSIPSLFARNRVVSGMRGSALYVWGPESVKGFGDSENFGTVVYAGPGVSPVVPFPGITSDTVELDDGVYRLDAPIVLNSERSGTPEKPVVLRARNRGKVVLSGMVSISDWQKTDLCGGNVWVGTIPGSGEIPGWRSAGCVYKAKLFEFPISVFSKGERLTCARWPKAGTWARADQALLSDGQQGGLLKVGAEADVAAWAQEKDLWAHGLWMYEWADAKCRVLGVDAAKRTIRVDDTMVKFGFVSGCEFYVFNALSALGGPGEWVVDRKARRLYVWPKGDIHDVEVALLDHIVKAKGVANVRFEGIAFEGTRRETFLLENVTNVVVDACCFRHTSKEAIRATGARRLRVTGSDFYDLGEGGVWIEGGDIATLERGDNVVDNCHISHFGKVVANYKPGICMKGSGNAITHNLIHHTDHQAIMFNCTDLYIGWNVIHDTLQHNDDAGAIYCCGQAGRGWTDMRGTLIEHNFIHNTGRLPRSCYCFAIYHDDSASGIHTRWNFINYANRGVYCPGGNLNLVESNLVVSCGSALFQGYRWMEAYQSLRSKLEKRIENPAWAARFPETKRVLAVEDPKLGHCPIFNRFVGNVEVGCGDDAPGPDVEKRGNFWSDNLRLKDETGCRDFLGRDWTLEPGSKAFAALGGDLGFEKAGLYDSERRFSPAVKFGEAVGAVQPPRPNYSLRSVGSVVVQLRPLGWSKGKKECFAEELDNCKPLSGYENILCMNSSKAPRKWTEYSFSFVPKSDLTVAMHLFNSKNAVSTAYDDFRVVGSSVEDDLETGRGWRSVFEKQGTEYLPKPPATGLVEDSAYGFKAAKGRCFALADHEYHYVHRLELKKGVRVTITFKARTAEAEK